MAQQVSLWKRMRSMFRPEAGPGDGNGSPRIALVEPAQEPEGGSAGPLKRVSGSKSTSWRQRRLAKRAQIRETSLRMVALADAMQQHFRRQDQRSAELTDSLERVGGILEQLAESQRSQGEYLRTIAAHTDTAGKHAAALSETLGRVPDSLVNQAEAIRNLARQLEVARESDAQLRQSLQGFGRAVDTLGSSSTVQVEVLERLSTAQGQQQESLTVLVREQSRRFLVVIIVAAVLALGALAALSLALAMRPAAQ